MLWMDYAELIHRPLFETLATVTNYELYLWLERGRRRAQEHQKG